MTKIRLKSKMMIVLSGILAIISQAAIANQIPDSNAKCLRQVSKNVSAIIASEKNILSKSVKIKVTLEKIEDSYEIYLIEAPLTRAGAAKVVMFNNATTCTMIEYVYNP